MKVRDIAPGYHIGFANEFYTLWYVNPPEGRDGLQTANYLGKISNDKNKAATLYPDYPFSGLKGESWVRAYREFNPLPSTNESFVKIEDRIEFWFGKYKDQPIVDCTDYSYLKWFNDEIQLEGRPTNSAIKEAMTNGGYFLAEGSFFETEQEMNDQVEYDKIYKKITNGISEITFCSNISLHDSSICVEVDNEIFHENHPYGMRLIIEDDSIRTQYHDTGRYQWRTLEGFRSMKGVKAIITTVDQYITKIELI